jgi:hypothetical protein
VTLNRRGFFGTLLALVIPTPTPAPMEKWVKHAIAYGMAKQRLHALLQKMSVPLWVLDPPHYQQHVRRADTCNICGERYVGLAQDCRCTNWGEA